MTRCSLEVGCDEAGVCYARANGCPDQCGKSDFPPTIKEQVERGLHWLAMTNEEPAIIWFSADGYATARIERDAVTAFNTGTFGDGTEATYMGVPFRLVGNTCPLVQVFSKEELERRKPPPPTEAQLATRLLDDCINGLEDWYDVKRPNGDPVVDPQARKVHSRVTIDGRDYQITVEVL